MQVLSHDRIGTAIVISMTMALSGIIASCVGVLHYESTADGATIKTADEVIWWAVVTTSTVGYGDYYPVTAQGKLLAALVMVLGIGLFATLAGAVASRMTSIAGQETMKKHLHEIHEHNHRLFKKFESKM